MTAVVPINDGYQVIEMNEKSGQGSGGGGGGDGRRSVTGSKAQLMNNDENDNGNDDDAAENNDYINDEENEQDNKQAGVLKKPKPVERKKLNENEVREYILNNIKQRKCNEIIPTQSNKEKPKMPTFCQCGIELKFHHDPNAQPDQTDIEEQAEEGQTPVPAQPSTISMETIFRLIQQQQQQPTKWDPEKHTIEVLPDSYGTIFFDGFGQEASRKAPFVRIDYKTSVETIWTLLEKQWNMLPPKLIISVTGGAKRLSMKPRLETTFKRGLINAVTAADAWIVTGGTKAGVMEMVGEAVRDYMLQTGGTEKKIITLGVASWGFVANRQALVSSDGQGSFPCKYKIKDLNPGQTSLDPFHTHFILVDNGTDNKPGVEIDLRVELESYIAKQCQAQLVLLVLEGGIQTLRTTAEAICRGTPVVVIKGSGRAADFIAYAFYKFKGVEKKLPNEEIEKKFYADLKKKAEKSFDWSKEKNPKKITEQIDSCVSSVKKILDNKKLLMVFHLDDNNTTNEIDQAILKVLLSAHEDSTQSQLELALAWNCIDVAREDIFNIEARMSWQKVDLGGVMQRALIDNKVEFVQLFLDSGLKLSKFLNVGRLEDLYQGVLTEIHSDSAVEVIRNLILDLQQTGFFAMCCRPSKSDMDQAVTLSVIGDLLDNLTDFQHNIYGALSEVPEMEEDDYKDLIAKKDEAAAAKNKDPENGRVNGGFLNEKEQTMAIGETVEDDKDDSGLDKGKEELDDNEIRAQLAEEKRRNQPVPCPERELFFWALLFARKDLAMLFWRMGRDHIGGALTASKLWKSLAVAADREEEIDLGEELEKNSREFEEIAIGVLNQCYQRDKTLAHFLLTRQLELWANKTLFTIADDAEHMDFMEQACCQTHLNKSWTGAMAVNTAVWKMLLGVLCFVTIPFIKYSSVGPEALKMITLPIREDQEDNNREPESQNYYRVSLCGSRRTISLISAFYEFLTAPQIKFCYYTLSSMAFLCLFGYVIIMTLDPIDTPGYSVSIAEIVLWAWTATIFMEEARQVITHESPSMFHKLSGYLSSLWNIFDVFLFSLFTAAVVLRWTLTHENFEWARMAYSLDMSMFFVRFLQVFFVDKTMGPKVIIIRGMLRDLTLFCLLLLIFILNYGIVSRALMYPNVSPSIALILQPYFMIFGSLDTQEVQGNLAGCTSNETALALDSTLSRCPRKTWLITVLFCIQLLLINIMMLNLLIAMFSYTFSSIQENSEKVWRFYRYSLIYEYFDKPTFAPPLIAVNHLWRILVYFYHRCRYRNGGAPGNQFFRVLDFDENKKLTTFERMAMENYMLRRQRQQQENIDFKVATTSDRMDKVIDNLEQIRDHFESQRPANSPEVTQAPSLQGSVVTLRPGGADEIAAVKEQLARQEALLNKIAETLKVRVN